MHSNRLQHYISIALILAVVSMLGWLSTRYIATADWTVNSRNTLTEPSIKLLDSMPDEIRFRVFIYPDKNIKRDIQARLDMYQREKDNLRVEYIDPAKEPLLARELDVDASGEVIIEYQGRRESLRALSEQTITTALQRLAYSGERVVRFLSGHGEKNIDGPDDRDAGLFAEELGKKGLKVEKLNLAGTAEIPADTSVLVIAGPQSKLLDGEVQILRDYVAAGGNMLWLADPETLAGLEPLSEDLAVLWQTGTVIYPDYQMMGTGHPGVVLALEYPPHPVTQDLYENTVFAFVGAMKGVKDAGWEQKPLLTSFERSWLETGKLDEEMSFSEEAGDQLGPLMMGVAMQRNKPGAEDPAAKAEAEALAAGQLPPEKKAEVDQQRVAVIGDSDFIANGFVTSLGNMQLGINLIQWLTHSDAQISIHIPPAPDNKLFLKPWAPMAYGLAFVLIAPLGFLGFGIGRWYVRRRR